MQTERSKYSQLITPPTVYVAGFLFENDHVWLVEKKKPEWQKGSLNGIGGKVEHGEAPIVAMKREFKEEAGILTEWWELFCELKGSDGSWKVYFFKLIAEEEPHNINPINDVGEKIFRVPLAEIHQHKTVANLAWLIPMALDPSELIAYVTDRDVMGREPKTQEKSC